MTEQQLIDECYKDGKKSFDFYVKEFEEHFKFDKVHNRFRRVCITPTMV